MLKYIGEWCQNHGFLHHQDISSNQIAYMRYLYNVFVRYTHRDSMNSVLIARPNVTLIEIWHSSDEDGPLHPSHDNCNHLTYILACNNINFATKPWTKIQVRTTQHFFVLNVPFQWGVIQIEYIFIYFHNDSALTTWNKSTILTLEQTRHFFQMILFPNAVHYASNIFNEIIQMRWVSSQHHRYWWPGAVAPGHQYPQYEVCILGFPAVCRLNHLNITVILIYCIFTFFN